MSRSARSDFAIRTGGSVLDSRWAAEAARRAGALALLAVMAVPAAIVALVLFVVLGTQLSFNQLRCGLDGRLITIRKFRTMHAMFDESGKPLPDRERLTPVSRLIRRLRLDEIPQLLAVFNGDLAFVGPRPLTPEVIATFGAAGIVRCSVPPGLTGWAQVNGNTLLTDPDKLALDIWYVDHRSLRLDAIILARTISMLLLGERVDQSKLDQAREYFAQRFPNEGSLKIAFIGAVEGSAIALRSLVAAGYRPGLILTLPLQKAGNHSDFADLGPMGDEIGSEVVRVSDINSSEALDALRAFGPDLVLVIGWSQICKSEFRSIARIGNIGFHPALLPRLRGRGVIPWTILLGERETGASLFWLDDKVDSGPILLQERISVAEDETARSLYTKQTEALARLLPKAIHLVRAGSPPKIAQDESRAVYCAKRTPDDGAIDWKQPREAILRLVRAAGDPYPGAFTRSAGRRLVIERASAFDESQRYIGLAGQVQSHTPQGFTVRCGDGNCIHVTAWNLEGGTERPRVHEKLESAP